MGQIKRNSETNRIIPLQSGIYPSCKKILKIRRTIIVHYHINKLKKKRPQYMYKILLDKIKQ